MTREPPKPEDEAAIDNKHDLMMDYITAATEDGSPEEIFAKLLIADVLDNAATLMLSNGNNRGSTICALLAGSFRQGEIEWRNRKGRRDIGIAVLASNKDLGTFKQRIHAVGGLFGGVSRTTVTNAMAAAKENEDAEALLKKLMEADARGQQYAEFPIRDPFGVLTRLGT